MKQESKTIEIRKSILVWLGILGIYALLVSVFIFNSIYASSIFGTYFLHVFVIFSTDADVFIFLGFKFKIAAS